MVADKSFPLCSLHVSFSWIDERHSRQMLFIYLLNKYNHELQPHSQSVPTDRIRNGSMGSYYLTSKSIEGYGSSEG